LANTTALFGKVWDGFLRGNWSEPLAIWTDSNNASMNWTFNVSLTDGVEPPINLAIGMKNVSEEWDNTGAV